jgi:large subunit ribosomal protein L25
MQTLTIKKREPKTDLAKLREEGLMPAVFYGRKEASTPITISTKDFKKIWRAAGESSVIVLEGDGEDHEALIHDIDLNPVTGEPRHADFYIIEKGKKVTVSIPIEFVGVSPAVKELGGSLVKVVHELEVEAFPKDLPQQIEVDISGIADFETHITVKDIKLPSGVTTTADGEEVVALVAEAKEEPEEEAAPIDLSSIEVEEKGKKEKEEEAAA